MFEAGHVLIGVKGELIGFDAAFCRLMHAEERDLRGRLAIDVTAPADREACATAIRRLRETGRAFTINKRMLRQDGSLVWTRNSVWLALGGSGAGTIAATIEPVALPEAYSPASLLDTARSLIAARRDQETVCDRALLSTSGWDAVLATYVAEAEGQAMDVAQLAARLGSSEPTMARWVAALVQHHVLEIESRSPRADTPKAFRLTAQTHQKLEAYLARRATRAGG